MKDSLEAALPNPGQSAMITLKGKEYRITPATVGDYLALKSFIRGKRIQDFMSAAGDIPAEERAIVLKQLSSETISETETLYEAVTTEGMFFMLWRSLQRTDTTMTMAKMMELLDDEDMESLTVVMKNIGLADEEDLKNPPGAATGSDGTT